MESCMTTMVPTASTFHPVPPQPQQLQQQLGKNDNSRHIVVSKSITPNNMVLPYSSSTSTFLPPNNTNNNNSSSNGPSSIGSNHSGGSIGSGSHHHHQQQQQQQLQQSTTSFHIYDGFATVRKRKGPSCASIAMRQQQECYDLAQSQSPIISVSRPENGSQHPTHQLHPTTQATSNNNQKTFFTQQQLQLQQSKKFNGNGVPPSSSSISPSSTTSSQVILRGPSTIEMSCMNMMTTNNGLTNEKGLNGRLLLPSTSYSNNNSQCSSSSSTSSSSSNNTTSSSLSMMRCGTCNPPVVDFQRNSSCCSAATATSAVVPPQWDTSLGQYHHPCSGTTTNSINIGLGASHTHQHNSHCACPCSSSQQQQQHSNNSKQLLSTIGNGGSGSGCGLSPSLPNNNISNNSSGRPRLKTSSSSSSSLSRKIRRLVLPSKLFPPNTSSSSRNNNKTDNNRESSCSSSSSSSTYSEMMMTQTRLRTSMSDNSIATAVAGGGGVGGVGCGMGGVGMHGHSQSSSVLNGGVPGDPSNSVLCHSNSQTRHFHRSCFLPKPPLEPVMEDGIPWRPGRKDVPWWELATKRYRYRSCPVLQVTPQQAHVVAAFEQSLSNMTQRLQSLSVTAEQKDSEVMELRRTIELLRKQSIEAGLTSGANLTSGASRDGSPIGRQLSADSVSSINSISSACSGTSHSHNSGQILMTPLGTPTHHACSTGTLPDSPNSKKKHSKNKGWLRSSFTKAFSRSKTSKNRNGSPDMDVDDGALLRRPSNLNGNCGDTLVHINGHFHPNHHHHHQQQQHNKRHNLEDSAPASPILTSPHGPHHGMNGCGSSSGSHSPRSTNGHGGHGKRNSSTNGICEDYGDENRSVDELKKQLREKEMVLTDIRLEALTSAHQLESFKETVNKMRNEMQSLKQDNERLQRMVTSKSLTSSQSSLQMGTVDGIDRRLSTTDVPGPTAMDILLADGGVEKDGKRIIVTVFLGCHGSYDRYVNVSEGFPASECAIGTLSVSSKTKWEMLDAVVRRTFKDYVMKLDLDQKTSLGLTVDSIGSYSVGEVIRSKDGPHPELLPCGYFVGNVNKIRICLKGAVNNGALDALAFETLIPKSTLQRYVSILSEQGRMVLTGPTGTGKSYLACKLGEFILARSGKDPCPEAIATFSADKNGKELRQYLANLAEQCETATADLPSVIILENLHQITSFGEVFNGFLHSQHQNSPIIIGTMSQSTSTSANLQGHHSFRFVVYGNNMDPVKGFLSRYLGRRLIESEVQNGSRNLELSRIFEWIPKVWQHLNRFLETYNSLDVTIGPRLFLSCPTDVANSQVWFTDLWHYSIVPYIIEAVKEGLQMGLRRDAWEDPAMFLLQTYPWTESPNLTVGKSSLMSVRPEDVGYGKPESGGVDSDPLLNMLMTLQEAANYSGPQSNDSDSTSLDSHVSESKDYTATA